MRRICRSPLVLMAVCVLSPTTTRAEGPADALLRLVPPDAGATLTVEDLRGHARQFLHSPLAEGLRDLPAAKAWDVSGQRGKLEKARRDIEDALGVDLVQVRDNLLGDAVVLTLHVAPDATPDQAKGLLLSRFRDRALLNRLIDRLNAADKAGGTLVRVSERSHGGVTISTREFRPGTKANDAYAVIGGDIFAWSNSTTLIQEAIDRHAGKKSGLVTEPRFLQVREALPERSFVSLFVDPKFLKKLAEASPQPEPKSAAEKRVQDFLLRTLWAVSYAGAALEWRDGLVLHLHESIEPDRMDEPLRRWAATETSGARLWQRIPPTALVMVAGQVDFSALGALVMGFVPEADRVRTQNVLVALRGVLMGKDVMEEVLPSLGPGMLFYLDEPRGEGLPLVLAVELGGPADSGIPAALENGLRTLMVLWALDPKNDAAGARVQSQERDGVSVTTLSGEKTPFAFAVHSDVLVLGTTAAAVAAYRRGSDDEEPSRVGSVRDLFFPEATTFAVADLGALRRFAEAHREALTRRIAANQGGNAADAGRDLDQALALMSLFRIGYLTNRIAPDFAHAHQTLGLIFGAGAGKP